MLSFSKLSGSGNDFIIIDNRDGVVEGQGMAVPEMVRMLCRRRFSVGADGLILIVNDAEVDFAWRFFNADGSEVEMCGNGGRCAAKFAYLKGIAGPKMAFRTLAGVMRAEVIGERVKLEVGTPRDINLDYDLPLGGRTVRVSSINTGVPHVVVPCDDLEGCDVAGLGRAVRYHPHFQPAGTNANFVSVANGRVTIRTYERGVEGETLACGTGSIAAALICSLKGLAASPVEIMTRGGETLRIHFTQEGGGFKDVFLEGGAAHVFDGVLQPGAFSSSEEG
jgi:diaminopimelate epimerase